jgi:hypothetical protein
MHNKNKIENASAAVSSLEFKLFVGRFLKVAKIYY